MLDADLDEYVAATRAARRASLVRAAKSVAVFVVALVVGGGVAFAVARWDTGRKEARLARYERGDLVVTRRGEDVRDTSPSIPLAAGVGGIVVAIVFATGVALVLKDGIYLRGVRRALDRDP